MKQEELTALGLAPEAAAGVLALYEKEQQAQRAEARRREERHQADMDALRRAGAEESALHGLAFSSASAKKAFAAELAAARLPVTDGALEGLDAFVERYRAADPAAFADHASDAPVFVRPAGGRVPESGAAAALRTAFGLDEAL